MNLNDTQKQQISKWIAEGAKLSDIQKRIGAEFGLTVTYMEVRLLVDDLKLVPHDPAPPPAPAKTEPPPDPAAPSLAPSGKDGQSALQPIAPGGAGLPPGPGGKVTLSVDALAKPGTLVSGSVTFSDGQTAAWYLDQMGRLGLAAKQQGYRPSAADVQEFQQRLEVELSKLGL